MGVVQNSDDVVHIKFVKCPSGHSLQLKWSAGLVEDARKIGHVVLE
jgi:hypothetical protein